MSLAWLFNPALWTPGQPLRIFSFGLFGSFAVEIVLLWRVYMGGHNLPARYRRVGFVVVRILLGVVGGVLAFAYGVQTDILAMNIGAAAPAIMDTLTRDPSS